MTNPLFVKRDRYEVYGPERTIKGEANQSRKYCWRTLDRFNSYSLALTFRSNIINSSTIMPDGSWNNDAVNLIILDAMIKCIDYIRAKDNPRLASYCESTNIADKLESALELNKDPLKESKMQYFKEKQELMNYYIDGYVPEDNPTMGFFALVH